MAKYPMDTKEYSKVMFYTDFPINSFSHQYYNSSRTARNDIFDSYIKYNQEGVDVFSKLSTIDISSMTFRLEMQYRSAMDFNYGVLIQEGKRYYFFIDDVQWSSNLITATLRCSCDWWQTYCYDIELKKSFVEREHVKKDTFGKYLLEEAVPTSEYIIEEHKECNTEQTFYYCLSISDVDFVWTESSMQNHPQLFYDYGAGISQIVLGSNSPTIMQDVVDKFVSNSKIDSINGFFICPIDKAQFDIVYVAPEGDNDPISVMVVKPVNSFLNKSMTRAVRWDDDGTNYVPNNNKCYIYPYNFVNITNYMGNSIIGKFELANDKNTISFDYTFPAVQEGSPIGYLRDYRGLSINLDESITGQINPQIPYITNTYSAWYSVNHNSLLAQFDNAQRSYDTSMGIAKINFDYASTRALTTGLFSSITQALSGTSNLANAKHPNFAGTYGKPLNTALNSGWDIVNSANQKAISEANAKTKLDNNLNAIQGTLNDQKNKGNISHGCYTPNLLSLKYRIGFQMQHMRVTQECIKVLDNYLDMFGYQVNIYKVPQYNSRPLWNYVKTSKVNLIGNVPQIALNIIKAMFDNGVTMWHTLSGMYDYDGVHNKVS